MSWHSCASNYEKGKSMIVMNFSPPVVWLLASMLLLAVELAAPGLFFFVSFAGGALAGAGLAAVGCEALTQCYGALAVAVVQFFIMHTYLREFATSRKHTNTNVAALIGQRGVVVRALSVGQHGLVKVGGEEWAAESFDGNAYQPHTIVEVMAVRGNRVIVRHREV